MITEGLLRFAGSPDEVAGVLAHEMGHVLHRHSTAAMVEALGLAFLFGAMLGDFGTGVIGAGGPRPWSASAFGARRKRRPTGVRSRSSGTPG